MTWVVSAMVEWASWLIRENVAVISYLKNWNHFWANKKKGDAWIWRIMERHCETCAAQCSSSVYERWLRQIWADWFAEVLLLKLSFHGMAMVNSRLKVWKQRIFRLSRGILSPLHRHISSSIWSWIFSILISIQKFS